MKIVIDIPEDVIEGAKSSPNYFPTYHFEKIWRAIVNGTPLPENHGRIVDLDTVMVEEDTDKGVLWLDAPTILEASYGK